MSEEVSVYTVSLGCPKNRVDTERMLGALGRHMVPADDVSSAQLVLVNTCGFIQPAIEESVQMILDLVAEIAEMEKPAIIAVAGCLVSRFGKDLQDELPEVDLWLSTHDLDAWPPMLEKAFERTFEDAKWRKISTAPSYAYLKIGEGCSHKCHFCTIPSIRGPHKSRTLDELYADAEDAVSQGIPELIIVGQDTTAYGTDLGLKDGLKQLIDRLLPLEEKGLQRLRLMYLYPAGLTEDFLSYMADVTEGGTKGPLLPYFDVPLQHAHPDVLASMGRPFARDPWKVIQRIRKYFPDAAIRTSLIVGYPGETEEQFEALLEFIQKARFHHMGVFPYWGEEGTPAAAMENQIDDEVKMQRKERAMALQAEISKEIMEEYCGMQLPVLVEAPNDEWPGLFTGRVWFQAPDVDGITYVSSDPEMEDELAVGCIVHADIESTSTYDLVALA
ncbi:MAG: 30S ribosomal protein S12 methylthiotransferase RimO [Desulfovibrio sp.]